MMKLLFCADLHLGTRFKEIKDKTKQNILINALKHSFYYTVEYAKNNNIKYILLSGDVFDKNRVNKADKDYFYAAIKANPLITFFYLKGNHDLDDTYKEDLENLKTFSHEIKKYALEEKVNIYGYELSDDNSSLYKTLPFLNNEFNLMMLHGDIFNNYSKDYIDLNKLKNKNISFLALGHIHKRQIGQLDYKTKYLYPGPLMGRGFDEENAHGFYILEINKQEITYEFKEISNFEFKVINLDVSKITSIYELEKQIQASINKSNQYLYLINLKGKATFTIDVDLVLNNFKNDVFYLEIKDKTLKINLFDQEYNDNALANLFILKVNNSTDLLEEEKAQIINYGLSCIEKEVK